MSNEKTHKKTIEKEILEEIAGFVFNKRLILSEWRDNSLEGICFRLEFRPFSPNKASLLQGWNISKAEITQTTNLDLIKVEMLKNAVENMIERSLDDINTVHHLKRSFWKRLKYLFIKKL